MGEIRDLGRYYLRKYRVDGNSATPENLPEKEDGWRVFDAIDNNVEAVRGEIGTSAAVLTEEFKAGDAALVAQIEAAAAGVVVEITWPLLSANAGTRDGQPGRVTGPDADTHADPVTAETVANEGEYRWDAAVAGWQRTGDSIGTQTVAALEEEVETARAGEPNLATRLNATEASLDARVAANDPTPVLEPLIITTDGYVVVAYDRRTNEIVINGHSLGLHANRGWVFTTKDGYVLGKIDTDGSFILGSGEALAPNSDDELFGLATADGYRQIGVDRQGLAYAAFGGKRVSFQADLEKIGGSFAKGAVTDLTAMGQFVQYKADGEGIVQPFILSTEWPEPAHLLDTFEWWVTEADGQSWQSISDYNADEVDFEDPSGATSAAMLDLECREAVQLRKFDGARRASISNGGTVTDLYPIDLGADYSIAAATVVMRAKHAIRRKLTRRGNILLQVGWPGQSYEKFLPEGASVTFGDPPTTIDAALVDGEAEYLWARNLVARQQLADVVRAIYRRNVRWDHLSWIQGPAANEGEYRAFLEQYRAEQDKLAVATVGAKRHMFGDQGGATTGTVLLSPGAQDQLEFFQANASGHDWLVGPRYPFKLRDTIHHSSLGALQYAEMQALAMADVDEFGSHEPLWFRTEDIVVSGSTLAITTNLPRWGTGNLASDTRYLPAAANSGFSLWNIGPDTEIPISGVALDGNTITITAGQVLEGLGDVEVGYASRGIAQPDGTVEAPSHMGCWGNVLMPSTVPCVVAPGRTVDYPLCAFRKTISM